MHIVVVDDEIILSAWIEKKLVQNDYEVTVLNSYSEFLDSHFKNVNLYLIDVSLWDWSGFDIVSLLRTNPETKNIPILLMSWHDDIKTKVEWLDIWADDYIVKPFNPIELLARVRSHLRRREIPVHKNTIGYWDFSYNLNKKQISYKKELIPLTKKERQIIEIFLPQKNILITKENIIKKLWGSDNEWITDNTVNVTICNLRKKLWDKFKLKTKVWEWYILEK